MMARPDFQKHRREAVLVGICPIALGFATFLGPMPNTGCPIPITCPKCQYSGCTLLVKSLTVMTCQCANCGHTWATALDALPPDIQIDRPSPEGEGFWVD